MFLSPQSLIESRRKRVSNDDDNDDDAEVGQCSLKFGWAQGVVAQLTERLLQIPENKGSNPVIAKCYRAIIYNHLYSVQKPEYKEKFSKRPGTKDFLTKVGSIFVLMLSKPS